MKKLLAIFLTVIFISSVTISALAADIPAPEKKSATYDPTAGPNQKLERGFKNAVFGWTEIPKRIVDKTKASNPIKGVLVGIFHGTCKAFARTISGVSEVLTFPVGKYDKPAILPDMPAVK